MNNLETALKELMEQYEISGAQLSAAANTLAANGKTPLGLNQWQRSDKPVMDDFNEDNRIIDAELRVLAEVKADKTELAQGLAGKANNPIQLPRPSDLNEITTPGLYYQGAPQNMIENMPTTMDKTRAFSLQVLRDNSYSYGVTQIIIDGVNANVYVRVSYPVATGGWTNWKQIAFV